jgi:SWI/SNF-related matrix-associated actin-dependent regulator 1 of chromatin subfamily A
MQRSLTSFGDVQQLQAGLEAKLLPHQLERVERAIAKKRILIGDQMGLGKTATFLASIEKAGAYPAVILTPASAEEGILKECRKWLPWRSSAIVKDDALPATEIIVMHPEQLMAHGDALKMASKAMFGLLRLRPKAVILDESHAFKNHESTRTKLAHQLVRNVPLVILCSGSIIRNKRVDLLSQLELLGSAYDVLRAGYGAKGLPRIESRRDLEAALNGLSREALHNALYATILMRTTHGKQRTGILAPKRHQVKCLEGRSDEYQRLEAEFVAYCKYVSQLRPEQKVERAQSRIKASSLLNGMRAALGSAKAVRTVQWATRLREQNRKAVIFTYHKAVALLVKKLLPGKALLITGDTPIKTRQDIVDSLASSDFLVATIDSMGTGVNGLQQHASDLAFVELSYVPTAHDQAEGRLRRHGQKARVQSYYMVTPESYDMAMLSTLQSKWKDAAAIMDGKNAARGGNFAEQVLNSIIAQRPWETGKIDWRAAGTKITKGMRVQKQGLNGVLVGQVTWVNSGRTSCRVQWDSGGPESYELPGTLTEVPKAKPQP